jgi:histone-lysine N-methyltransferase SETD1
LEKLNSSTLSSSNSSSANSSPYEAFCPEHYQELDQTSILQYQHWQPSDPTRCLVTETCTEKIEIENVATILSQGRTDVAVKSGAVTILKIGKPLLEKNGFSTTKHIYPHHFMSCRIFWSMKHPGKRTVYFFDILEKNDLENWELKQIDYLQRFLYNICQEYPIDSFSSSSTSSSNDHNNNNHHQNDSSHKIDMDVNDLLNGAIFRVAALDSLESPLFAKSVDQLYAFLLRKIRDCSADFKSNILHIQPRKSNHSYNLTSHQFFGLGLPFVQEAIEMIPESIMTMITMNEKERYSPYFRLPSQLDIANVLKHQNTLQSMFINTTTINGASRADPYQEKVFSENISIKITQTKSTGRDTDTSTIDNNNNNNSNNNNNNNSNNNNNENREDYLTDINKENSKAELESRKLRFLDMTKAYIRNPYAKLEVKKSRIHGWGLFSKINYEKDDVIIEYIGEKIRQIIADYREINYEKEGVGSCYLFRLDKDEIIDATKIGGMSRFINHCCEPNAYAKVLTYENNETKEIEKHIVIFADKNIQVNLIRFFLMIHDCYCYSYCC